MSDLERLHAPLPEDFQQKLYAWAFNVMLEESGYPDGPIEMAVGGATLDFRDLHQILTWAAGSIAGLISARPDFDGPDVPLIDDRASILTYLQSEATKRKGSRIESRVLRAMVSNIRAEIDRG